VASPRPPRWAIYPAVAAPTPVGVETRLRVDAVLRRASPDKSTGQARISVRYGRAMTFFNIE